VSEWTSRGKEYYRTGSWDQTQDLSQTLTTEEEGAAASSLVPRPFLQDWARN